jgi:nucleoside-diphosphate-sugar epimerase
MRTLDRGRFLWIGDGSNRESLLYKGDAARACMAAAERPASGINIYNVSAPACNNLRASFAYHQDLIKFFLSGLIMVDNPY